MTGQGVQSVNGELLDLTVRILRVELAFDEGGETRRESDEKTDRLTMPSEEKRDGCFSRRRLMDRCDHGLRMPRTSLEGRSIAEGYEDRRSRIPQNARRRSCMFLGRELVPGVSLCFARQCMTSPEGVVSKSSTPSERRACQQGGHGSRPERDALASGPLVTLALAGGCSPTAP